MRATSSSSKAPSSVSCTLVQVISSSGVPYTTRVPPWASTVSFKAAAAPAEMTPIRSWPQPWPISGRASYSHRKPSTGLPEPYTARKAVGRPWKFSSTAKPCLVSHSRSRREELISSSPGSGFSYISRDMAQSSGRKPSTVFWIASFTQIPSFSSHGPELDGVGNQHQHRAGRELEPQ